MNRPYTKRIRAQKEAETHERIVQATLDCWAEDGPLATTISAVAARANVQRLTLYRHFESDSALAAAAAERFFERHRWPDPADWISIGSPTRRLRRALRALYSHYDECGPALAHILRDADRVPALADLVARRRKYLDGVIATLVVGWRARGKRRARLEIALAHAVELETWLSLKGKGLGVKEGARVMGRMVRGAI